MINCMGFGIIQTSDKSRFNCSIAGVLEKLLKVNSLNLVNSSGELTALRIYLIGSWGRLNMMIYMQHLTHSAGYIVSAQ